MATLKISTRKTFWFHVLMFSCCIGIPFKFLGIKPIMHLGANKKNKTTISINFKTMEVY